jgi:hypothetical protein
VNISTATAWIRARVPRRLRPSVRSVAAPADPVAAPADPVAAPADPVGSAVTTGVAAVSVMVSAAILAHGR